MDARNALTTPESARSRDGARVREFYRSTAVAESYDSERFSGLSGRTFNLLERAAFWRALARATHAIAAPLVFDAPCGTGRVTEWLLQRGFRVTAADISEAMLAVAARRCAPFQQNLRLVCTDLERLAIPDDGVDVSTCIRLFHHLPSQDRVRILAELARVTRHVVVANLSLSTPYYRFRRGVKRFLRQGISRQSCTYADIHAEAKQAGLRVGELHFVAPYVSEDVLVLFRKRRAA